VNVALYRKGGDRWAMTERGRGAVSRDDTTLTIGPSTLSWADGVLTIAFDERGAPLPGRLKGVIRLYPEVRAGETHSLDAAGRHRWRPIAPRARVEVELEHPAWRWSGDGYFDTNDGDEPLEAAFVHWNWARAHLPNETLLFYDVDHRDGGGANLALRFAPDGAVERFEPPPLAPLAQTFWRVDRALRAEPAAPPRLRRTLEDTPFYTRSMLDGCYGGQDATVIHESLSLDRLRLPIVKAMLPFRMPRRFW
jgi:carotenoid 1,2-hydratase